MSDNGQEQTTVRSVHVTSVLATGVSTDDPAAIIKFQMSPGEEFAITFPLGMLAALRLAVRDLMLELRKRSVGVGNVPPIFPRTCQVGHSDSVRGTVMLLFEPQTPDEVIYCIPDRVAMGLADEMKKNVLSRMTPQDRARMVAPSIVLPPGFSK